MPAHHGGEPRVIAYVYGGQGTINVPSWSPDSKRLAFVSNTAGSEQSWGLVAALRAKTYNSGSLLRGGLGDADMEIPVLIEPIPGIGYRASSGEPFAFVVEAATAEDALARFKDHIASKLRNGASVATVEVQNGHPWAKAIGIFDESDPLVREWLELVEQNRSRPEDVE